MFASVAQVNRTSRISNGSLLSTYKCMTLHSINVPTHSRYPPDLVQLGFIVIPQNEKYHEGTQIWVDRRDSKAGEGGRHPGVTQMCGTPVEFLWKVKCLFMFGFWLYSVSEKNPVILLPYPAYYERKLIAKHLINFMLEKSNFWYISIFIVVYWFGNKKEQISLKNSHVQFFQLEINVLIAVYYIVK